MTPNPSAVTQEQMILAQARNNVLTLEPRLETIHSCLETLEDALAMMNAMGPQTDGVVMFTLVAAMVKVQLIQLNAALKEGQSSLHHSKQVIEQIENPVKVFAPFQSPSPRTRS